MKRLLIAGLALLIFPLFVQAEETVPVKSTIKKVTVFLRGAQVERMGAPNIPTGTSYLKFDGLSPYVDPNSIQVQGSNGVTILSVKHQMNHLTDQKKTPRIIELEDSVKDTRTKLAFTEGMQQVYTEEERMILANKSVKGDNTILNIEDIEDVADFYRDRLADIKLKQIELLNKRNKMLHEIARMEQQLRELNAQRSSKRSEIIVEVASKSATRPKLTVSYMIYQASWTPIYDLRAKNTSDPVTLNYKAQVRQNTGIDWENVDLVLSTGNPALGGNAPDMQPWRVKLIDPAQEEAKRKARAQLQGKMDKRQAEVMRPPTEEESTDRRNYEQSDNINFLDGDYESHVDDTHWMNYGYMDAVATSVTTEFRISRKYSIPTDNKNHMVYIQDSDLPAAYSYYTVPKLDQTAYLQARVTDWDELNLLPGQANIYFEGTYVGQSFLDPNVTNDTLDFSLGRDQSVVVTREVIKDFAEKKNVGSNRKITSGYEIKVRNTKNAPITIRVQDQLPLTTDKEIEVELIEANGARKDETTGFLTWEAEIAGAATKSFVLKYSVKHPKNKQLR